MIFATLNPQSAIDNVSNTVLGALVILLGLTSFYLLKKLLEAKDQQISILREVQVAVNNVIELQKAIKDK